MGEQYVIRHEIHKGYEPAKNEVIENLPPLALAVLLCRLNRDPSKKQLTGVEIWKAWAAQHGKEDAPGRMLVARADAVLESRGYKHRLIRREGRDRWTVIKVHNLPVMHCSDADCASCAERGVEDTESGTLVEDTESGTLHDQGEQVNAQVVEDTAFEPLKSGTSKDFQDGSSQDESQDNYAGAAAAAQLNQLHRYRSSLSGDDFQKLTDSLTAGGVDDPAKYIGRALSQQAKQDKGQQVTWVNAVPELLSRYLDDYRPPGGREVEPQW